MKRLKPPRKYGYLVAAVLMPLSVSLGGTFLATATSAGLSLTPTFLNLWFSSWLRAYEVALPISLLSAPFVRRIVERVTR